MKRLVLCLLAPLFSLPSLTAAAADGDAVQAMRLMRDVNRMIAEIEGRLPTVNDAASELTRLLDRAPAAMGIDSAMDAAISRQTEVVMTAKKVLSDDGFAILKADVELAVLNHALQQPLLDTFIQRANAAASRALSADDAARQACMRSALRPMDEEALRRALGE